MKVAQKISRFVEALKDGQVFGFQDLKLADNEHVAAVKALSRLVKSGELRRAVKGKYYKPEQSPFGELKVGEQELLDSYLFVKDKRIAYVTGAALYNRLYLTTQVPGTVQLASRNRRIVGRIGNLRVKAVKSYVDVNEDNYKLLEILDAIKDFRRIPDRDTESAIRRLANLIKSLSKEDQKKMVQLALKYPPRTRALAGALLEQERVQPVLTKSLLKSLNPLSTYNFAIPSAFLNAGEKWKIR